MNAVVTTPRSMRHTQSVVVWGACELKTSVGVRHKATVRFSTRAGGGASLELRAADQTLQSAGPLPSTVAPPPLFVK